MKKRTFILLAGAVGIAAAAGFITRSSWMGGSSNAQGPQRPRMVSVELATAERKSMCDSSHKIATSNETI